MVPTFEYVGCDALHEEHRLTRVMIVSCTYTCSVSYLLLIDC